MTLSMLQHQHHPELDASATLLRMDISEILGIVRDLKQENVELKKEIASLKQNAVIDAHSLAEQVVAKMGDQMVEKCFRKIAFATDVLVAKMDAGFDNVLRHCDEAVKEGVWQARGYVDTPQ